MPWAALELEIADEFEELTSRGDALRQAFEQRIHRRVWGRAPIACRTCGTYFTPLDTRRVFCSGLCKARYHATRSHRQWQDRRCARRLAQRADRVCADPRCRRVFTGRRSDSLYCSHGCRDRWRALKYQRRRARGLG